MAAILSQEVDGKKSLSSKLGKQILDVITSGMYSDPRMAVREYVQNAADSIDLAEKDGLIKPDKGEILITVDGKNRCITIEDNGMGVGEKDIDDRLGSLGCSAKFGGNQRGFRGIGRLAGLAYCEILQFETRQSVTEPVYVVEWSGRALREQTATDSGHERLTDALKRIAHVYKRPAQPNDPVRFFRAKLMGVHRFHSDLLMNIRELRDYLAQTAPVPYTIDRFGHAKDVIKHLSPLDGFRNYRLLLNGAPVCRPYEDKFHVREGHVDTLRKVELIECVKDGQILCKGWYAITGFLAALPSQITMRGLRVRQGNIAIGDEYFLKEHYSEPRFSTWHIGELNVSSTLRLNARRDGFEESPEYEHFLEWVGSLCRHLSSLARKSSSERSTRQNITRATKEIEKQLGTALFIDKSHAGKFLLHIEKQLDYLRRYLTDNDTDLLKKLTAFEERVSSIRDQPPLLFDFVDGRTLRNRSNKDLLIEICDRILSSQVEKNSEELLLEIVKPYLKSNVTRRTF